MISKSFSAHDRANELLKLDSQVWDTFIIGGGATGAACARDAALRGMKCLLVEAGDFASGTSSGSSKLLHGGVRYLQNFEFGLVFHAIQERELLSKLYAPLVKKIDFVFPTYKKRYPPRWLLNIGLGFYDAFSGFREHHTSLSYSKCIKKYPLLKREKLSGAQVYADSFAEDYRLVIEMIKSAHHHGATCVSRLKVEAIEKTAEHFKITARDPWSKQTYTLRAKNVVNCAGPFSDDVRSLLGLKKTLHLTQGVHFIVDREKLPIDEAYVLSDPEHDRILFAIPWRGICYLGTTDTDVKKVSDARATSEDLDYVLEIFTRYFDSPLKKEDVIQSWAAVRPLIQPESSDSNSEISREHHIEEKPEGCFHILGGKLTSHRLMAEEALDLVAKRMNKDTSSSTEEVPLQDQLWKKTEDTQHSHLEQTYGRYAEDVRELDQTLGFDRKVLSSKTPHLVSEVIYAARYEMVMSPIDFLRRRSSLYYENPNPELVQIVGKILAKEFSWTEEILKREVAHSLRDYEWDLGFREDRPK